MANVSTGSMQKTFVCQCPGQNRVPSVQQASGSRYSSTTSTTATSSTSGLMSMVLPSEELVSSCGANRAERKWFHPDSLVGTEVYNFFCREQALIFVLFHWKMKLVQVQMCCSCIDRLSFCYKPGQGDPFIRHPSNLSAWPALLHYVHVGSVLLPVLGAAA